MGSLVGVLTQTLGTDAPSPIAKPAFDSLTGYDVAMYRNTDTGKFDIQWDSTNNVQFDSTRSHAVLSVLYENKGRYWADKTGNRGSYLSTVKEDRKQAPSRLAGYAQDALQLLVDNRNIVPPPGQLQIPITATRVIPGRIDLSITYSTPQAQGTTFTVRPSLRY